MAKLKFRSEISNIEVIARGSRIHDLKRLQKAYGKGSWRKLKGVATVDLPDGTTALAEVHWYEAHGIGPKEYKIKDYL